MRLIRLVKSICARDLAPCSWKEAVIAYSPTYTLAGRSFYCHVKTEGYLRDGTEASEAESPRRDSVPEDLTSDFAVNPTGTTSASPPPDATAIAEPSGHKNTKISVHALD